MPRSDFSKREYKKSPSAYNDYFDIQFYFSESKRKKAGRFQE